MEETDRENKEDFDKNDSFEKTESEEKTEKRIDNNPDSFNKKISSGIGKKISKNPWMIVSSILAVIVIILLISFFRGGVTGSVIAGEDAGENIVEYLNSRTGGGVEYISVEDLGSNLYAVTVSYENQEIPVFVTKDGGYFVQGAVPLTGEVISSTETEQPPAEVIKSDKPEVELFVMTHCTYGTQAEKGILPVLNLLGDKIDGTIRFVHYFMHEPEETETPIQVCIREEQSAKYLGYLECFLEDGDSDRCLDEINIDKTNLNKCINDKSEGYYLVDSELSEGYGVMGSPTLVVNGAQVSSGRDSASYLATICSAFNDAPIECIEELSSASPSPGFGYSVSSGESTTAQC